MNAGQQATDNCGDKADSVRVRPRTAKRYGNRTAAQYGQEYGRSSIPGWQDGNRWSTAIIGVGG